jgi:microcystin-dependent protein
VGTFYGGNGQSTFALPDLQGNAPMHQGNNGQGDHFLGEAAGESAVQLLVSEIPLHTHAINVSNGPAILQAPAPDRILGRANNNVYLDNPASLGQMSPDSLAPAGGSLPHNNMQPYLTLNFCIALQGVFPPRT